MCAVCVPLPEGRLGQAAVDVSARLNGPQILPQFTHELFFSLFTSGLFCLGR